MFVRRHIEYAMKDLSPGDIVLITFTDDVNTTAGNLITGVREMYRGVCSPDGTTLYF